MTFYPMNVRHMLKMYLCCFFYNHHCCQAHFFFRRINFHCSDPHKEANDAEAAGFEVVNLRSAHCQIEFFEIGAIIRPLRKCIGWVPDFSVEKYRQKLLKMVQQMRDGIPFIANSTWQLIEARR